MGRRSISIPILASPLILAMLALAAVLPALLGRRMDLPPTPYIASTQYAMQRMRANEIPLWNPHEQLGAPLIGDGKTAMFYPVNAVHLWMDSPRAWPLAAALNLWLAAMGTFLLAGRFDMQPAARLAGAAAFMLGGMVLTSLRSAELNVIAWLPWTILCADLLLMRVTAPRMLLTSLILTIQFLGGDVFASGVLIATAIFVILIRGGILALPAFVLAGVIAAVVAGIQLVPLAENFLDGARMVVLTPPPWPWELHPIGESPFAPAFVGVLPILLAAVAVTTQIRRRGVIVWLIVASFALANAMLLRNRFPLLARPHFGPAGLAIAMLASFGLDGVLSPRSRMVLAVFRSRVMNTAVALGGLTFLGTITLTILFAQHRGMILTIAARSLAAAIVLAASAGVLALGSSTRPRRLLWCALLAAELLPPAMIIAGAGAASPDFLARLDANARYVAPDISPQWATLTGLQELRSEGMVSQRFARWCDALGLQKLAQRSPITTDALNLAAVRSIVRKTSDGFVIDNNPDALGRAWSATRSEHFESQQGVLAEMSHGLKAEPDDVALVEDIAQEPTGRNFSRGGDLRRGDNSRRSRDAAPNVTFDMITPEEIHLGSSARGGWIVVSQQYAPGWRATIFREYELPVVPAFGVLQAVQTSGGSSQIVLEYRPPAWRHALFVSCGGVLLLLLMIGFVLASIGAPSDNLAAKD